MWLLMQDLGLYYKTDKYYGSFSVTHINQPKIKYQ